MGAVYLATHLGTTRTIAIKVIVPELAQRDEFILRFQREAEAAGRLRHPNVVNVTDFGLTTLNGTSLAYLVMEYLDGQSLGEHQAAHGRPQIDLVLDIVDQVALALDAAHQAGIVDLLGKELAAVDVGRLRAIGAPRKEGRETGPWGGSNAR
jgi:serine/threonine-protein kinase